MDPLNFMQFHQNQNKKKVDPTQENLQKAETWASFIALGEWTKNGA